MDALNSAGASFILSTFCFCFTVIPHWSTPFSFSKHTQNDPEKSPDFIDIPLWFAPHLHNVELQSMLQFILRPKSQEQGGMTSSNCSNPYSLCRFLNAAVCFRRCILIAQNSFSSLGRKRFPDKEEEEKEEEREAWRAT